ncbi:hypothetical protein B0H13DRAFT_1973257 [Mycena leptocephala]|nr:hypothetical protein B0H13DRAFT_1973257 [Mycena leptocephala]
MSVLPDEIISEILSPALKVSDELFSDTSDVSPFAKYSPSTSAYLVVCRDWLRANALEKVLETHKEFGRFIKKLRVEGGYGIAMHTILKCAPNITDIFLSLAVWSSDNTQGLCKGLPLSTPAIRKPLKNQNLTALTKVILGCIVKWDNLRVFDFPYLCPSQYRYGTELTWRERSKNLAEALAGSQTVHTVLFGELWGLTDSLLSLSKVPTIQVLQLKVQLPVHTRRVFDDDPRLKSLVRYPEMPDPKPEGAAQIPDIAPSLNPSFIPMESASEQTREVVWKRVLFFAMYVEELRCPSFSRRPRESHPSRLPILLVSKYFNRLALPYIYDCPNITQFGAHAMARQLKNRPELGSFIRFIFINRYLPLDTLPFQILANATGSSLKECSIRLSQGRIHASCSLLSADCFQADSEPMPENLGLSKLGTLRVSHLSSNNSILHVFSMIRKVSLPVCFSELDSLHTARFEYVTNSELFRLRHLAFPFGSGMAEFKLFDVCKQLVDVELLRISPPPQAFTCETPHGSLVKIIMADNDDLRDPDEFDFTSFPALREIQIRNWKWPTTERAISKCEWIAVAEAWLNHGIKVTDSEEQHWIPRVKRSRKR